MIELLVNYLQMLEGAFFFIVPWVLLLSVGGSKAFKPNSGVKIFICLSVALFVFFLIYMYDNSVSRYIFVPVVLLSMLAGGFQSNLERIFPRWKVRSEILLFVIAIIACLLTTVRQATPYPKKFVFDFAQSIKYESSDKEIVLCGISCSSTSPIASFYKTLNNKPVLVYKYDYVGEFIDFLPNFNYSETEIYLLLDQPKHETTQDFQREFQASYYLFPFELVREATYRKKRYMLWRYTGRFGDGHGIYWRQPLLDSLPSELKANTTVPSVNFSEYFPAKMITQDDFIVASIARYTSSLGMSWGLGTSLITEETPLRVHYYNELFWPEAVGQTKLMLDVPDQNETLMEVPLNALRKVLPADDPPLVMDVQQLFVSSTNPVVYLTGAVPGNGIGDRMAYFYRNKDGTNVVLPNGRFEDIRQSGLYQFEVKDQYLKTSSQFAVTIKIAEPFPSEVKPPRILFLNDSITDRWELEKTLNRYWEDESAVATLTLPVSLSDISNEQQKWQEFWSQQKVNSDYEIVFLNIFTNSILLNRTFQFNSELFKEQFATIVDTVRRHYPQATLVCIIPPPPAEMVRYPGSCNGRVNRLSHFRFASKLLDATKQFPKIMVLPLVCSLNSYADYQLYWNESNIFSTPYGLNAEGKAKVVSTILSWLKIHEVEIEK